MAKLNAANPAMFDFSNLVNETKVVRGCNNVVLWLYGPGDAGKTTMALSWSDYFPNTLPAKELTHLDDGFLLQCDDAGSDTLIDLNLTMPNIHLKQALKHKVTEGRLRAFFDGFWKLIKTRHDEGKTNFLIIDGWSSIDSYMHLATTLDGWEAYGFVGNWHIQLWQRCMELGIDLIITSHAADVNKMVGFTDSNDEKKVRQAAQQEAKRKANALPGDPDVALALDGKKASQFFYRQLGYLWPVKSTVLGKKTERYTYPHGLPGWAHKNKALTLPKRVSSLSEVKHHLKGTR